MSMAASAASRLGVVLGVVLGVLSPLGASGSAADADADDAVLSLAVRVDQLHVEHDHVPLVRIGDPVVVTYRVRNESEHTATDVHLTDDVVGDRAIQCPAGGGSIGDLPSQSVVVCTARTSATAGKHAGSATAVGRRQGRPGQVSAHEFVGYTGVAGRLTAVGAVTVLNQATATLPARVSIAYTVGNSGNLPVDRITVTDHLVPDGGMTCQAGQGAALKLLPAATVTCTAVVTLPPGSYVAAAAVQGSDETCTVGPDGNTLPPPALTAQASAAFTLSAPPKPAPTPTTPLPPRASHTTQPRRVQQHAYSPSPAPQPAAPRPTPSATPTPTPSRSPVIQGARVGTLTPARSHQVPVTEFLMLMVLPSAVVAVALAARRK